MEGTGRVKNQPVIKHKSHNPHHGNNAFAGTGTRLPGFEPQLCVISGTSPFLASFVKWA